MISYIIARGPISSNGIFIHLVLNLNGVAGNTCSGGCGLDRNTVVYLGGGVRWTSEINGGWFQEEKSGINSDTVVGTVLSRRKMVVEGVVDIVVANVSTVCGIVIG